MWKLFIYYYILFFVQNEKICKAWKEVFLKIVKVASDVGANMGSGSGAGSGSGKELIKTDLKIIVLEIR